MSSKQLPGTLAPSDYEALAEFRYQIRRFLRFSEDAARAAGLAPQQHQLLLTVKGMPGGRAARISDLAERMQIQHHSAVELVDRLAARGLVHRALAEEDRREVYVRLTSRGESVLRVLTLHHKNELSQTGPALVAILQKVTRIKPSAIARRATRTGASSSPTSHVARVSERAGA